MDIPTGGPLPGNIAGADQARVPSATCSATTALGPTPGRRAFGGGPRPANSSPVCGSTATVARLSNPPGRSAGAGHIYAPFTALTAYMAAPVPPGAGAPM